MKKIIKSIAILMLVGMAHNASALLLTSADSRYLGLVEFAIPSGDADRTAYVNYLIDMGNGTTASALGQTFTRSANYTPASLSDATFFANDGNDGSYTVTGAVYMLAKYDGPNYGALVWNVTGLTDIEIALTAGGYGLSGVTFFKAAGTSVPDGG